MIISKCSVCDVWTGVGKFWENWRKNGHSPKYDPARIQNLNWVYSAQLIPVCLICQCLLEQFCFLCPGIILSANSSVKVLFMLHVTNTGHDIKNVWQVILERWHLKITGKMKEMENYSNFGIKMYSYLKTKGGREHVVYCSSY